MNKKKKIIYILFFLSFLLLVADIVVKKTFSQKKVIVKESYYPGEINALFLNCLEEYGIKPEWIKEKKLSDKTNDSTFSRYIVTTPNDLSIVEVLISLNDLFYYDGVVINSKELKMGKDSELRLFLNDKKILEAYFKFDPKLSRNGIDFSVIVDNIEELTESEVTELLDTPSNIAFSVVPGQNGELLADEINKHGKDYIIELNDDIEDEEYVINEDQHPEKILKSLSRIFTSFSRTNFILIENTSDLYNSQNFAFIKRNIPSVYLLKKKSELINLGEREPEELKSMFRFFCEKPDSSKRVFVFDVKQFDVVKNEIQKMRKKGNRIISPSKLLVGT